MAFQSIESLLEASRELPLWEVVRREDCRDSALSEEDSTQK